MVSGFGAAGSASATKKCELVEWTYGARRSGKQEAMLEQIEHGLL